MQSLKIKISILLCILLVGGVIAQDSGEGKSGVNYLTFTPEFQSLTANSGEQFLAYIDVDCFGSANGGVSFGIYYNDPTPDNGYIGHDPAFGGLFPGEYQEIEFTFNKTVSSDTTVLYPFRVDWFDEVGDSHQSFFDIEITYLASVCTLPYPGGRTTNNITSSSAQINWNPVSGNSGYHSQYKATSSSTWIDVNNGSSNTNQTITGLSSSTTYEWRVRTKCSNGSFGNWSPSTVFSTSASCSRTSQSIVDWITGTSARITWVQVPGNTGYKIEYEVNGNPQEINVPTDTNSTFITNLEPQTTYWVSIKTRCSDGSYSSAHNAGVVTIEDCPEDLVITRYHVIDNTYFIYEASNSITSDKQNRNGSEVHYNAGNKVTLLPGFAVKDGSTFRAYTEGCTPGFTSPDSPSSKTNITLKARDIKLFPNPTRDRFIITSEYDLSEWSITNHFGNVQSTRSISPNNSKQVEIDISSYPTGIYYVTAIFKDGEIVQKMLIKE